MNTIRADRLDNGRAKKIRVALIGVGNCASSLVQGVEFYKNADPSESVPGLMHVTLGGYHVRDIEFTAAFDVNVTKVGKDLSEAIFAEPNNTYKFSKVPHLNVKVHRGMTHDGLGKYLQDVVIKAPGPTADIVGILKETKTDVVVSYLPVGSEMATKWYVEQILEAGCAFINCIPVFIASQPYWQKRFADRGLPIIGDDIKSQVGATITHRVLTNLFRERGVHLDRTYQLNFGGNTDFMNMLERERLESKKISKTRAVTSQLDFAMSDAQAHVGPSDYVPWLEDRKWCYIRMEGTTFGNVPLNCELKLEVWDSPNSAGVVIDAVRCAKLAMERGMAGALIGPSSYFMKSPPQQFTDNRARELVQAFIRNEESDHDRSHQTLERAQQSLPLGLHDGSPVARVFGNDTARGNGDSAASAGPAADTGRHFAD
ncbi:MAG TPA: inositol-3-phosphate synthase [Verrucomicrobiae bacterium]|nr:inositol-3-phosphate synthase [Verrucomicrobiae bacterium]